MPVKKQYIVLTGDGLSVLYETEVGQWFLSQEGNLVWIPDFEAQRLISLFTHVEHYGG